MRDCFFFIFSPFLENCVSFHFFLFFFCLRFFSFPSFKGYLHSGRSMVARVTVGRDTNQSFRVCKVNLATLKVATRTTNARLSVAGKQHLPRIGLGRKPLPLTKNIQLINFNVSNTSQLSHHCDIYTSLPSQPFAYCYSPSLMEGATKRCNSGQTLSTSQDKTKAHNLVLPSQHDSFASSEKLA